MLVAFSHLRWDFVWQRPQHLLSRFAREMPVVVVEEPEYDADNLDARVQRDGGVTIITPRAPGNPGAYGFGPHVNHDISRLLGNYVSPLAHPIYWYYTPMALGAEPSGPRPSLTVFDAMDDLASFLAAPPALRVQEARLLQQADLVFTGGPTLYRQRRGMHPSVHCFPSGVEPAHFARPRSASPAGLAGKPEPIIGFYGVIDERLDLELIAEIADRRPEWTIALVGPVVKIDPATVPVRPNIVQFGQQSYADLPAFLSCFDVAMMPFARNEATRSISPTKTLEYLAGGKPVVSTPLTDVINLYGDVVEIAATGAEFVAAIERVLRQGDVERQAWQKRAAHLVAANDWDAIAAQMVQLMARTMAAPAPTVTIETAVPAFA